MTKILLVEDDKSLREIYGVRLLAEGYDIVTAGDGEEALAMAIKERPQLIVSDVMMPKISGFDMLDILRSTSETKNIKVIMMTALSSEDQRARGEALGADRYLVKSQVGIEDVVRTVHEVLGDAPVSGSGQQPTPQQTFGGPGQPPAGARPAPTIPTGQRPDAPAPARTPQPIIVAPPQPEPQAPPQPVQPVPPQPQPGQTASGLPQPTAPFSTNRPAGLGDRIIHPISQPEDSTDDIARRMQQELDTQPEAATRPSMPTPPQSPVQPPAEPIFQPAVAVQQEPQAEDISTASDVSQPASQPPQETPEAPTPQQAAVPSQPDNHGINYEETPRAPTPPQTPLPPTPGSQPQF